MNETVIEQRDNITNSTREVTLLFFHYILNRKGQLYWVPHNPRIIYPGLIHDFCDYIMYVHSSEFQ